MVKIMLNSSNGVDQEVIKDSNRKRILNLILKKRELTKQDIAREIGVSIPTVIANVNELMEEGLVEEAGVAGSTGGRKPVIVRFLPDSKYSFGVEFALNCVRIILTNLDSEIKFDTSFLIKDFKDINYIMKKVREIIEIVIEEKHICEKDIIGIGFSLPGTVNEEKLVLELAPNMGMKNVDFNDFSELLRFPVYIENEANLAAFGELNLGIAKEMKNLVYISITDGIGAGIVIQDHLYKGKNKRAGEFGHMIVAAEGRRCNCGRKGCLEQYASQKALLSGYNDISSVPVDNLREYFSRVDSGEVTAVLELEKYVEYLAVGIQNIVLSLDPHYIVIGGEICDFSEQFLERLRDKVFIPNSFYDKSDLKLFVSKLKGDASILGAALLPLQKIFSISEKII